MKKVINEAFHPAILDGYLRHVVASLHHSAAAPPIGWTDWYSLAVASHAGGEQDIIERGLVYDVNGNQWLAAPKRRRYVNLISGVAPQPRVATTLLTSIMEGLSHYFVRYKDTGYRPADDPKITHLGQTKLLSEWANLLGLECATMQLRYDRMRKKGESTTWLLRPRYQHRKFMTDEVELPSTETTM